MKNRTLATSFNRAADGIVYALRSQRNIKIHFALAFLVLLSALFLDISRFELIVLLFAITLVIVAELINTAIEMLIDMITTSFEPAAKITKDIAAGAVLIASINAVLLAYFIFFRELNPFTLKLVKIIGKSPIHVTYIAILIVIMLTVVIKAMAGRTSFFHGGFVSGHAAIAFALATAIAFLTRDTFVTTLAFLTAAVVFHSRVESKVHTIWQVIGGGTLGTLVTVLIFQLFYFS